MRFALRMKRIAIVTGGNRGIGLEVCRQLAQQGLQVVLTARDAVKGERAAASLRDVGLEVAFEVCDVTDPASIRHLRNAVLERFGRADVLVNNAAILLNQGAGVLETNLEDLRVTLEANLMGPWLLCQAFVPGMVKQRYGRVVNVSSTAGQLSGGMGWAPAYSASKTALNALTVMVAGSARGNVLVNSVCPGWVRTDMGGHGASKSVEAGADSIVWLATLPDGGPTGGFFSERREIPW